MKNSENMFFISSRCKPTIYKQDDTWILQCHPNRKTRFKNWNSAILQAIHTSKQRFDQSRLYGSKEFKINLIAPKIFLPLKRSIF